MDSDATQHEGDDLAERVAELEGTVERMVPSRRQFLTGAAAVSGFALGTGSAAAADTSDGRHAAKFGQYAEIEGPNGNTQITLPAGGNPRVTEFENQVGNSKIQTAWDGLVVPIAAGLGASDAIDPSNTSTPLQDAQDAVNNAGNGAGCILLPPETVTEGSEFSWGSNTWILGWGPSASVVSFPNQTGSSTAHGMNANASSIGGGGFTIEGPGNTNTTGAGLFNDNGGAGWNFPRRIDITDWGNRAVYFPGTNGAVFECKIGHLRLRDNDAGGDYLIRWETGQSNEIGQIDADPDDSGSGVDSGVFLGIGVRLSINQINISGTAGEVSTSGGIVQFSSCQARVDHINYEPIGQNATAKSIVEIQGGPARPVQIGHIENRGDVDYAAHLRGDQGLNRAAIWGITTPTAVNTARIALNGNMGQGVIINEPVSNTTQFKNSSTACRVFSLVDNRFADPLESGTVTVSTGGNGSATLSQTDEGTMPKIQHIEPSYSAGGSGDPGSTYGIRPHVEWSEGDGAWLLRVEWETDPGSDVDFDYEIARPETTI